MSEAAIKPVEAMTDREKESLVAAFASHVLDGLCAEIGRRELPDSPGLMALAGIALCRALGSYLVASAASRENLGALLAAHQQLLGEVGAVCADAIYRGDRTLQ